jgi:hypothetical protein
MPRIRRALLGSATCHLLLISAFLVLGAGSAKGPIRGVVDVFLVGPGGADRVEAKRSIPRSSVGQSRARANHPPSPENPITAPLPLPPLQETIAKEVPGPPEQDGPPGEVDPGDPAGSAYEMPGREVFESIDSFPASEGKIASISPAGPPRPATVALGPGKPGGRSGTGSGGSSPGSYIPRKPCGGDRRGRCSCASASGRAASRGKSALPGAAAPGCSTRPRAGGWSAPRRSRKDPVGWRSRSGSGFISRASFPPDPPLSFTLPVHEYNL